jgi:ATP-dependent helicase/nuclease subunit A
MMKQEKTVLTPHQAAALHYKNHISLTANAGSGKTFVLSQRYLEIAVTEEIPLRNIAAITFTDKAASELYKKIAGEVDYRLTLSPDDDARKKLERIRRQLVSANISTIHAFCVDILREFPVEASLDANFQPIDENLSNELVELSVDEVIKSAFENPDEVNELKYLIRNFASRKIFTEELFFLIKNRKNVTDLVEKVYNKPEKEISEHFYNSFLELANKIFLKKKDSILKNLQVINEAVFAKSKWNQIVKSVQHLLNKLNNDTNTEDFLRAFGEMRELICTSKGTIKIRGYAEKDYRTTITDEIIEVEKFIKETDGINISSNHEEIEIELSKLGKTVIKFFKKTALLYEQKKRENGYVDYEDILLYTKEILKNSYVRNLLSEKYKYIMIDEYQDTNEIQYRIFLPILDYLKTGNLFVVGDEKQSIYMFRDAELEVFAETKRNIGNTSGSQFLLNLPDSFRMAPAICLFTNLLFNNLFSQPNEMYNEVDYSELICARENDIKGKIEIIIGDEDETSPDTEAELVAKRILNLLSENKEIIWSDIAVLVRKRKSFKDLEKIFSKYRIPFNVVGGTGFYQRQSVYDIYNYFSFLLDKNNDAALVGILRSPYYNLSDAQIFEISRQSDIKYWDKLKTFCQTHPELNFIVSSIEENLTLSKSYDPTSLLRKIFDETNYLAVLTSKLNGQQELANIDKLLSLTTSFNQQDFRTLYDYVSFLKDSIDKTDDESQAAVAEESNSVKAMTIHQAKGLEFKVVFLFNCDDTSPISTVRSKNITVSKEIGLLTKVPLNENYFADYESAPVVNIHNHIARKKDLAEIKRLFYVSVTRAMNYLFITGTYKKDFRYREYSFLGLLLQGLGFDLDSESFGLTSDLKFLKRKTDGFETVSGKVSITIPVIKKIEEYKNHDNALIINKLPDNLELDEIKDFPEGEIISATKVSIFHQCPLKYKLTYDYGFSELMNQFSNWKLEKVNKKYEFQPFENGAENIADEKSKKSLQMFGDIRGRVIHKILQQEIQKDNLREITEKMIKEETDIFNNDNKLFNDLTDEIVSDLIRFYESGSFSEMKKNKNYRSEFEVYTKEDDYFLYGIIDRLIFEEKKAIIIDFKTDNLSQNEIGKRFETYLTQLRFYSYIVSRLYRAIDEFQLKIIFIKHPDENASLTIKRDDLVQVKNGIDKMVRAIRLNTFNKNLSHCPDCVYAINHKHCIVN